MFIKTNISSVNVNRVMKFQEQMVDKNLRNVSTGLRINVAADDASGLAVSERMTAQIKGLNRAEKNALDGISFLQTAEGYLQQTNKIFIRIRELAIQAANGIYSSDDRIYIQVELSQLINEVDRIASYAEFNGVNLLTGRFANEEVGGNPTASMWLHVGANTDQSIRAFIATMTAQALGVRDANNQFTISISSPTKANQTIAVVDEGLQKIHKQMADFGGYNNRLDYVRQSLAIGSENLVASRSRIRDANIAEEVSDLVKNQILSQAQTAMLAQSNQKNQSVLSLLQ